MSEFLFWEWLLSVLVPTLISIYAVLLARKANIIAEQSDKKMVGIANLEFDEKLARMAQYFDSIHGIKSLFEKNGIGAKSEEFLNTLRSIKNDFYAVSNLREYASVEKKEELIRDYIIPILKDLHFIKNLYIRANMPITQDWIVLLKLIKECAMDYDIDVQRLEEF